MNILDNICNPKIHFYVKNYKKDSERVIILFYKKQKANWTTWLFAHSYSQLVSSTDSIKLGIS